MRNRDTWVGIVLALFGVVVLMLSLQYKIMDEYGPGSGFLPMILSVTIIIMSLILFLQGLRKSTEKTDAMFPRPKVLFSCLGVLILTTVLLDKLGFVIVIWLATAFFIRIIKSDFALSKCFLYGLISTIVFYFVFSYALGLNLPKGVIPL